MNSSLKSALKAAAILLLISGCGPKDGANEFADGKAAYEVRDLVKAGKFFEKSLKYSPDNVEALVYLARVRLELGELASARETIAKASEFAAGDSDVILLSSQIAWYSKDYAAAAKGFASVAENAAFDPTVRAEGWAGAGVVEMACNNRHLAHIAFLRAIRLDRRNAAARYHLAVLYRDSFEYYKLALEQFEIFVRLEVAASPRVQKVQRAMIPALKERIAAIDAQRPGVAKRNSGACAATIAKAQAAEKKGDLKGARKLYQDATAADPLSYPAALGLARLWQRTDSTRNGMNKALEAYRTACSLSGCTVSTFLAAGAMATKLGQHATAVEIYTRAVAASPNSLEAVDGLVAAMHRAGNSRSKVAAAYQRYREVLAKKRK